MHYKSRRIPEWVRVSEKLLDYVLSSINSKTFIKKIEDPEYAFIHDEHLMERTVMHFKELKGMYYANKLVNASDWGNSNLKTMNGIHPGKLCYLEENLDKPGDSSIVFKRCDHCFKIYSSELRPGAIVWCSDCEEESDAENCKLDFLFLAFNRLMRLWKRDKRPIYPKTLVSEVSRLVTNLETNGFAWVVEGNQENQRKTISKENGRV